MNNRYYKYVGDTSEIPNTYHQRGMAVKFMREFRDKTVEKYVDYIEFNTTYFLIYSSKNRLERRVDVEHDVIRVAGNQLKMIAKTPATLQFRAELDYKYDIHITFADDGYDVRVNVDTDDVDGIERKLKIKDLLTDNNKIIKVHYTKN